jgi:hypothetical protein
VIGVWVTTDWWDWGWSWGYRGLRGIEIRCRWVRLPAVFGSRWGFVPGQETENQEAYAMRRGFWETQRWDFGSAMVVQMA